MLLKIQLLQLQNIPRDFHSQWGFIYHHLSQHLDPQSPPSYSTFELFLSSSFSSDMVGREDLTQPWYGQRCRHAARQREREICLVLDTLEILYRILHIMLHFSSNAPFLLFYIRSWERKENIIVTPFSSPSKIFMLAKYSKLPRNLTMRSGSDSTQLHQRTISQG